MQVGSTIGRFQIEQPLGQGGMAMVYQVRHRQLDTVHALKLLKISHPSMARRLLQEGRIQARLRHPNVVAVADVVEHEGAIGLLMEYVQGFSLEECLADGAMDLEDALDIFRQILAGVGAAHAAGITHRDLKPGNILLTTQGDRVIAKVTDFGIAKVFCEDDAPGRTRAGVAMGTPGYMAPEQISDASDVDQRADIFALGTILYEMLSGMPAFRGPDQLVTMNRTTAGTYLPLCECNSRVPRRISDAVDQALCTDRERRLADCAALARALFGDDSFIVAPELPPAPILRRLPEELGAPTLAPMDHADSLDLVPDLAEGEDEHPTADTDLSTTQASILVDRWELPEDLLAEVQTGPRVIGAEEEEEKKKELEGDKEGMDAEDAASLLSELFWSLLTATLWAIGKVVQYGGIPIVLTVGLTYFIGTQTAQDIEAARVVRETSALSLHKAMDQSMVLVPGLVEAGANADLLQALARRYEEAQDPQDKAELALELASAMSQQLGMLAPASSPAEESARREVQATLASLEREAGRYASADRDYRALRASVGARVAGVYRLVPDED